MKNIKTFKLFETANNLLDTINSLWPHRGRDGGKWEGDGKWFNFDTTDRGSRTDHGGGEDGDGWMDEEQIETNARPFRAKWEPKLKDLAEKLAKKGIKSRYYVDYGEKGHVSLQLTIEK